MYTVTCILSHRQSTENGFIDYVAGQVYELESYDPLFFEETGGSPPASYSIDSAVTEISGITHYANISVSGGSKIYDLPSAASVSGRVYVITKTDNSANTITLQCANSETIDGKDEGTLSTQNQCAQIAAVDGNWQSF